MDDHTLLKRVLVPLANPKTAWGLLDFASRFIDPENGKILALFVSDAEDERTLDSLEEIRAVIEQAHEQNLPVELVERQSVSPERGILDSIRELNAELTILGYQAASKRRGRLSELIEEVAEVCPTDLLIYRYITNQVIEHILVPVRDSPHSRIALRQALSLAQAYQVPVEVLHVQTNRRLYGQAEIERLLREIPEELRFKIEPVVIQGQDIANTITRHGDDRTMIVLGFTESSHPDQWLYGEIPQEIISKFNGPIVLAKRAVEDITFWRKIKRRIRRIAPILTSDEQEVVTQSAQEMARANTNFLTLLVLATMLATLGLLQNSNAVIIGAMLVAPLMSPLMSFGVGMAQGKLPLLWRSFLTVLLGVTLALVTSMLVGMAAPLHIPTAEMLARGQPTILDMGVAFVSGIAAAFALARKGIPGAIAGVAIAAALVPPICTTGLALTFGNMKLFSGAALLFSMNLISISLAAFLTFSWMGLRSPDNHSFGRSAVLAVIIMALLSIPLTNALVDATRRSRDLLVSQEVLTTYFTGWDVTEVELEESAILTVIATLRGTDPPTNNQVGQAEKELIERVGHPIRLEIILLRSYTSSGE